MKKVDVKVDLIDESCLHCPFMEINSSLEKIWNDVGEETQVTRHKCVHLDYCEMVVKHNFLKGKCNLK